MNERYLRFEGTFLDRHRLKQSAVLVGGAGALGNEVCKNLAMLGVGRLLVVDYDTVELHNLTRSVLLCIADLEDAIHSHRSKADYVALGLKQINPDVKTKALSVDIASLGPGMLRPFDAVLSAFDNPKARLVLQERCARADQPMIDGGLGHRRQEIASGSVTAFRGGSDPCYGCVLGRSQRAQLINEAFGDPDLKGCSQAAPRIVSDGGQPSTPMMASIVGGAQALLAAKVLMKDPQFPTAFGETTQWHLARAFRMESLQHGKDPSCPFHHYPGVDTFLPQRSAQLTLSDLSVVGKERWGKPAAVGLPTELWPQGYCLNCQATTHRWQTRSRFNATRCSNCGKTGLTPQGDPLTVYHPAEHPEIEQSLPDLGFAWGEQFELHNTAGSMEERPLRVEVAGDFEAVWNG